MDATTRGFLALTVACATCHDHKYDPIPTKDYYSLLGIFKNTDLSEYPLAPKPEVDAYKARKKQIDDQKEASRQFIKVQSQRSRICSAAKTA